MEKHVFLDVRICSFRHNCSDLGRSIDNDSTGVTIDTLLQSKLHYWEDYIVAFYLLTVGEY